MPKAFLQRRHRAIASSGAIRLICALALVGLSAELSSSATVRPAKLDPAAGYDVFFGDGGTSDFYRWSGAPLTRPGVMLRQEAVGEGFHAEHAAVARRILYSSTDGRFGRGVVEASGLVYLPAGAPPAGGWPLLVWGHGTLGIADVCAPSWARPTPRDGAYIDFWLKQGFAVVAPDYQGLGTPGVHPYLQRKPEGYSVLDAARAALAAYPETIANKIILSGQSQGSGAVLNATVLAHSYARDLNVLGTVGTALVWRASETSDVQRDASSADSVRYAIMRILGGGLRPGAPPPAQLLSDKTGPLKEAARTRCSRELGPVLQANGIDISNAYRVPPEQVAAALAPMAVPSGKMSIPIFIGTGLADVLIPSEEQYRSVLALCRAGNTVSWHRYDGASHNGTLHAAAPDALVFARARLAGVAAASDCAKLVPPGPRQPARADIPFNL